MMRLPQIQRTACHPRVAPTPETAPPIAWVVEIGTAANVAKPMVVAAANSAENPPMGRSLCLPLCDTQQTSMEVAPR